MKRYIAMIVVALLLTACGATKKLQSTKETCVDSTLYAETHASKVEKSIDTTRTESGKITITEIEFFPPTPSDEDEPDKPDIIKNNGVPQSNEPKTPPTPRQGAVKSIKQTVIEANVEQKGESKESSESNETESAANVSRVESNVEKQQEPTPDPYRWRYIFYISLIGVAALLYLKRVPIVDWLKRILSGILKIL